MSLTSVGSVIIGVLVSVSALSPQRDSHAGSAAYPELSKRGLVFTVASDRWRAFDEPARPLNAVVFRVGDRQQHDAVRTMLTANVEFTEDGVLYQYLADPSSPWLNPARSEALGRRIAALRTRSEVEIAEVMREAGARFGPDRGKEVELEIAGQFHRLDSVLGRIRSTPPRFRADDRTPRWVSTVNVSNGTVELMYTATHEPFEGRLVAMTRSYK